MNERYLNIAIKRIENAAKKRANRLDLRFLQLAEIPSNIKKVKDLKYLNLRYNRIRNITDEISKLKGLTHLALRENELDEIPFEVTLIPNLTHLYLRENNLTSLPNTFENLTKLEHIQLHENKFTSIPEELFGLKNLRQLYLRNNQIKEIPKRINQLVNLEELYLGHNQITKIPYELIKLPKLKYLDIQNNPIKNIPLEIAYQGVDAIRKYYIQSTNKLPNEIIIPEKWKKMELEIERIKAQKNNGELRIADYLDICKLQDIDKEQALILAKHLNDKGVMFYNSYFKNTIILNLKGFQPFINQISEEHISQRVSDLVELGQTSKALKALKNYMKAIIDEEYLEEIILLSSSFNRLEANYHRNIIFRDEYDIGFNKINVAIMRMVRELRQK